MTIEENRPNLRGRLTCWASPTSGVDLSKGYWVIKQKTANDRFSRSVRSIDSWCQANRHLPLAEQQAKLNEKLTRALCVLWSDGQLGCLVTVSPRSRATMAQMA